MDLGLKGKVAMVAAASKGLGYGIAKALAEDGAGVALGSRTEDAVKNAADRLRSNTGSDVRGYVLDASNAASIQEWSLAALKDFGGVDMLVVNAGGPPAGLFSDFDDTAWQKAFELTLMSAVRMIRCVIPAMKARGGGSILAITSSTVKEPVPMLLLSNVMRSGVTALLKTLSMELA
ncbi:MAG: SDR family NAD(P)-dependent oxidoreductase, partial [Spirochaetia bacterium]|nr:SDR family NAD(P)-dependent oxidoreductase [Spirochaetia bacterium]